MAPAVVFAPAVVVDAGRLNLQRKRLLDLPEEGLTLETAKEVNLEANHLAALPDDLAERAPLLEVLYLQENNFSSVPACVPKLTNLRSLGLKGNAIAAVPENIAALAGSLQRFTAGGNCIAAIPDAFCQLVNLQALTLEGNALTRLPDDFGNLKNLSWCLLLCNHLLSLPASFAELTNLIILDLSHNKLEALPSFRGFTKIKMFGCAFNPLTYDQPAGDAFGPPDQLDIRGVRGVGPGLQSLSRQSLFVDEPVARAIGVKALADIPDVQLSGKRPAWLNGEVFVVGNGPIARDIGDEVDACDTVVRFNRCNNMGKNTGTKTTALAINFPMATDKEFWPLVAAKLDLPSLEFIAELVPATLGALKMLHPNFDAKPHVHATPRRMDQYPLSKMPSIGFTVLFALLELWHVPRVTSCGFGHIGMIDHNWAYEKAWFDEKVRTGCIVVRS